MKYVVFMSLWPHTIKFPISNLPWTRKFSQLLASFSNVDGYDNENVKTAIILLSKTTNLYVHHAFLYISLPLLHDYGHGNA